MNTIKQHILLLLLSVFYSVLLSAAVSAQPKEQTNKTDTSRGDKMIADYFEQQTIQIEDGYLSEINSPDDWLKQRATYVEQLQEMLGLNPMPEKTPLMPQITGKVEHDEFTVENIHFQSRPGLYAVSYTHLTLPTTPYV